MVCKQGSVVSFHALALEKEPQPEDERRDGEVDRHSNEKPRSDNLREKSNIEGGERVNLRHLLPILYSVLQVLHFIQFILLIWNLYFSSI